MPRLGGVIWDRASGLRFLAVEEPDEVTRLSCDPVLPLPPPPQGPGTSASSLDTPGSHSFTLRSVLKASGSSGGPATAVCPCAQTRRAYAGTLAAFGVYVWVLMSTSWLLYTGVSVEAGDACVWAVGSDSVVTHGAVTGTAPPSRACGISGKSERVIRTGYGENGDAAGCP